MKNTIKFAATALFLLTASTISCVDVTASDTISSSKEINFPGGAIANTINQSIPDQTVDNSVPLNVKDAIDKFKKAGDLNFEILNNSLKYQGDISFMHHIKISIVTSDHSLPERTITDFDIPTNNSGLINIPLDISTSDLETYLGEGEVSLHFWVTGKLPSSDFIVTHTLTILATDTVNKSISDIANQQ